MGTQTTRQSNNHAILAAAHEDFYKTLNDHAFFKTGSRVTGEDLVQKTFEKTWRYIEKGGNVVIMRAFLYHILNNFIIDEYRKKNILSLDALGDKGFEPSVNDTDELINRMDGRAAMALIEELPEPYKKIMQLRYRDSKTVEQISEITGRTKNTVTVQAHRGLAQLKILCGFSSEISIQ